MIFIYRLCIETPRTGTRLLQTADEHLLKLAKERELMSSFDLPHNPVILFSLKVKIPVIVVFTKYDYLVVEHFRACNHISSPIDKKLEALSRAERAFSDFTKGLKVPFAPVSTLKDAQKDYGGLFKLYLSTSLFPV